MLWELLAENIVHFEVETREETNEVGSSSSTPVQLRNEWGGEPTHLTALQELGKLAMVSNTSDEGEVPVQVVRSMFVSLIAYLADECNYMSRNLHAVVERMSIPLQCEVSSSAF